MEICITFGGVTHCYFLPIFEWPIIWPKPGPGPINYPALFQDAIILGSIERVVGHVSDERVRGALTGAIESGMKAMQERAGRDVALRKHHHAH